MIIGVGTGRNGSKSLAKLLGLPHEMQPRLTWKIHDHLFEEKIDKIKEAGGDVDSSYLNYLPRLIEDHGAKVVCLIRDRDEVVDSFMRKTHRYNHWTEYNKYRWDKSMYDKCFPNMGVEGKRNAIGLYWDLYKERIYNLLKKYPDNIAIFDTDALNSKEGQRQIFKFCEIPEDERNYQVGIRLNQS